ncbi:MAG TPA: hypothetical protein PLS67_02200 [Accumulibacter sp.]|jgi:hypothetical protein|nr:hypothetical protein [Accumulibacter sp.]HQC79318.1 hypothetical protein [Accumulibacter sp.]
MSVNIGEVATTIEALPAGATESAGTGAPEGAAFEVRLEELRPLIRALVAEEMERWWRQRSDCP